ncbi:crotonase/enoyl-CoA hydratase family protein [Congregibacter litoralis]|uniref:Enoyl-CoA hydratase/carnithine racemase n=1 Tax=Congregibacter litoralis KT71 TaxID=314285 RepID=A4A7N0_9GAMM|nr:crotonase/enoyl-CoA hydratase family protein [Congregibacter litoralis]EAQ98299.1 Enoyl-CoA hydratase/carnithine racemase [Congregibacter litoralis KT71]
MTELVTTQENEHYTLITMDDGKANALSFDMFDALNAALDTAEATGKVVIIAGRPGKFSAGFDLSVMGAGGEPMIRLLRTGAELSVRLLSFSTPVVLAVSGHALAMGALLCLSADYRVGMKGNYKLGLNEVAIGMTLPWFGIELARARLDETQINDAVGLAHVYDPDSAVSAGYLDEAVEADQLIHRAVELAEGFSALNMAAHKATKARVREPMMASLEEALRRDFEAGDSAIAASN